MNQLFRILNRSTRNQLSNISTTRLSKNDFKIRSAHSDSATHQPTSSTHDPSKTLPKVYGVTYVPPLQITRKHTKRGDYGLYDGLKVRSGDQVSKSKNRSKRVWKPNVQVCKLWSEILGQSIQLRVTAAALKTIDQVGGLDRYILQMSDQRLGGTGIRIRSLLISAMKEKVRLSRAFTQPISPDQAWRIPQWQDAVERADKSIIRKMVASVKVGDVKVYPRRLSIDQQLIQDDMLQAGRKPSQTSRRSTHPRR